VYRAKDPQLPRDVALKVLRPEAARERERRQEFLDEARKVAAQRHSNVVKVWTVGEDRGLPYVAYEFIEGESLANRLTRQGRVEGQEALAALRQMASAIDHLHRGGVYHGDIKPANIMIDASSGQAPDAAHATLVDFGLSGHHGGTGPRGGTAQYMAPELFNGSPLGPAGDIYALGVTAYELLVGRPPFVGNEYKLAYDHGHATVPADPVLADCEYRAICRAMAKEAEQRWQTAAEFVNALDCRRPAWPPWLPVAAALLGVALLALLVSMCRGAAPAGQVTLTPTSVMVTSTPFATDTPTGGGRGELVPTDEGRGNPTPGFDAVALVTDTPAPTPSKPPTRRPIPRSTPMPGPASGDAPPTAAGLSEADDKATRRAESKEDRATQDTRDRDAPVRRPTTQEPPLPPPVPPPPPPPVAPLPQMPVSSQPRRPTITVWTTVGVFRIKSVTMTRAAPETKVVGQSIR